MSGADQATLAERLVLSAEFVRGHMGPALTHEARRELWVRQLASLQLRIAEIDPALGERFSAAVFLEMQS